MLTRTSATFRLIATGSMACRSGPTSVTTRVIPGIQQAFNEFHNNLHVATQYSIGPAAPGLHNGQGGEIVPTPCSVTTPPQ